MRQKEMVTLDRAELSEMTDSAAKRQVENGLKPLNDKVDLGFRDINTKLDMALMYLMGDPKGGIPGMVKRVECLEEKNEYFDAREITRKRLIEDYTTNGKNWNTAGEYARNVKAFLAVFGVVSIGSVIAIINLIQGWIGH